MEEWNNVEKSPAPDFKIKRVCREMR